MGGEGDEGEGQGGGDGDKGGKGARGAGAKRGGAPGAGEPPREVIVKEMELTQAFQTLLTKGRTLDNLTRDSRTKVSVSVVGEATVLRIEGTQLNVGKALAIVDRLQSRQAAELAPEPPVPPPAQ
jgi:hypothetical protein